MAAVQKPTPADQDPRQWLAGVQWDLLDATARQHIRNVCLKVNKRMMQTAKSAQRKEQHQAAFTASLVFKGELFYNESNDSRERYVIIQCEYNRDTKQIKYAQAVFKLDKKDTKSQESASSSRVFDRKKHSAAAMKRFEERAIIITNVADMNDYEIFKRYVRKLTFKYKGYTHGKVANKTHNEAC